MSRIKGLFFITVLTIYSAMAIHAASPNSSSINITGRKTDVDLTDLIGKDKRDYSETELRKLCAEITDRYYSLGYTGFRIRRAEIRKDGSVLIEFSEPVVQLVTVKGAGAEDGKIASDLYTEGAVFNEFTLNQNIKSIREKYSVRKVSVDLSRSNDDGIDINAKVVTKRVSSGISAASDPVYGAYSSVSFEIFFNSASLKTEIESSPAINDAFSNRGTLTYLFNNPGGTLFFLLGAGYSSRRDYFDNSGNSLFKEKRATVKTSAGIKAGSLNFFSGFFEEYSVYNSMPGVDNRFSFSGIAASFNYDDRSFMLDPLDFSEAGVSVIYGRNHIEENTAVRIKLSGDISIPFTPFSSLAGAIDYRYTSEDDRIYHEYVFDRDLPCRKDEFTTSSWRGIVKAGILFDLYSRLLYISPQYIAAFYDGVGGVMVVQAPGIKVLIKSGLFSTEIAYCIESGGNYKDAVLSFSAAAGF